MGICHNKADVPKYICTTYIAYVFEETLRLICENVFALAILSAESGEAEIYIYFLATQMALACSHVVM